MELMALVDGSVEVIDCKRVNNEFHRGLAAIGEIHSWGVCPVVTDYILVVSCICGEQILLKLSLNNKGAGMKLTT